MKFIIERTSSWDYSDCPCEGATKEELPYGNGAKIFWTMDFATLEDLMTFVRCQRTDDGTFDNGIVIQDNNIWPYPTIEIYDDYRE